ncbi:hypothetical protein BDV3_006478 [Batrachochytrium dendrobatidis]
MPPRFHVLTAGFKTSFYAKQSDTASNPMLRSSSSSSCSSQVNLGVASQSVSNSLGNTSSNHISDEPQPSLIHDPADGSNTMRLNDEYNQANSKTSFIADKRKSRLGTSTYLSKRLSLQEDEKLKVQIAGPLLWNFPASERSGKKTGFVEYFFSISDGQLHRYQSKEKFEECSKPISTISIANAMSSIVDAPSHPNHWLLRLILVEDNETHIFESDDQSLLLQWKSVISRVALRWGAIQKITLEHDVAHLRKQLGSLWEMCQNGVVPPKVQKRMSDVTMDMQIKDDLLADVIARQEELSLYEARNGFEARKRNGMGFLAEGGDDNAEMDESSSDEQSDSDKDSCENEHKESECESPSDSIPLYQLRSVDAIHSTYNDDDKPLENITEPTQPVVDTCSAKHSIDVKSKISETMLDNTTPIVQHESTKKQSSYEMPVNLDDPLDEGFNDDKLIESDASVFTKDRTKRLSGLSFVTIDKIVREGLSRSPTRVDGSTSKQSPTTSDKIDMAFADLIDKKLAQLESESEQDIYLKSTFQKTVTADSEPLANTADLVECIDSLDGLDQAFSKSKEFDGFQSSLNISYDHNLLSTVHNDNAIPAQSHDNQAKFESAETPAVTVLKHVETVAKDTTQRNALTEFNDDITKKLSCSHISLAEERIEPPACTLQLLPLSALDKNSRETINESQLSINKPNPMMTSNDVLSSQKEPIQVNVESLSDITARQSYIHAQESSPPMHASIGLRKHDGETSLVYGTSVAYKRVSIDIPIQAVQPSPIPVPYTFSKELNSPTEQLINGLNQNDVEPDQANSSFTADQLSISKSTTNDSEHASLKTSMQALDANSFSDISSQMQDSKTQTANISSVSFDAPATLWKPESVLGSKVVSTESIDKPETSFHKLDSPKNTSSGIGASFDAIDPFVKTSVSHLPDSEAVNDPLFQPDMTRQSFQKNKAQDTNRLSRAYKRVSIDIPILASRPEPAPILCSSSRNSIHQTLAISNSSEHIKNDETVQQNNVVLKSEPSTTEYGDPTIRKELCEDEESTPIPTPLRSNEKLLLKSSSNIQKEEDTHATGSCDSISRPYARISMVPIVASLKNAHQLGTAPILPIKMAPILISGMVSERQIKIGGSMENISRTASNIDLTAKLNHLHTVGIISGNPASHVGKKSLQAAPVLPEAPILARSAQTVQGNSIVIGGEAVLSKPPAKAAPILPTQREKTLKAPQLEHPNATESSVKQPTAPMVEAVIFKPTIPSKIVLPVSIKLAGSVGKMAAPVLKLPNTSAVAPTKP